MTLLCKVVFLSVCLTTVSCSSSFQDFSTTNDVGLRNLLLVNGSVIVGSSTKLYKLNTETLAILNRANLTGINRLLLQISDASANGDILSCQRDDCLLFDSKTFEITVVQTPTGSDAGVLLPGEEDLAGIDTSNTFFAARNRFDNTVSAVSKISYSVNSDQLELSVIGKQLEQSRFTVRKFLTVFKTDEYVYYIFDLDDDDIDDKNRLRIIRLCVDDPGGFVDGGSILLTTYTEAILQCISSDTITVSSATSATFDNQSMVLVSLYAGNTNHICSFNVSKVNEAMDNKLEDCKDGIGSIVLDRPDPLSGQDCPTLTEVQQSVITPCNRGGITRLPFAVDNPLYIGSSIWSSVSSSGYSSLTSFTFEDVVYVLAGTVGGIEQFYYEDNALNHVRTVNLTTMSEDSVSEIHISFDKEAYYTLTEKQVAKYPVNVCDQYTSCQSCVESGDPLCGWCTLSSSCTKLSDCTTSPQVWGTSDGECPTVTDISPSFVYVQQLDDAVDPLFFTITHLNIPNVTYECVYQFEGMATPSIRPAEVTSNETITCLLPLANEVPSFGQMDTLSAGLSLRTVLSSIDVGTVQFTDCTTQTTCFNCLSTDNTCFWYPSSMSCMYVDSAEDLTISGDDPEDFCPFIQSPTGGGDYLIQNFIDQKLTIRARNLQNTTTLCRIENSSNSINYTLNAIVNNTHVVCDSTLFNVSLTEGDPVIEASLSLLVDGSPIENLNNAQVVFYSCSLLGSNCGHCLSIDLRFDCVYCDTECTFSSLCTSNSPLQGTEDVQRCDPPTIKEFNPTAGPLQGNTSIDIRGSNLGAKSSQVSSITIGNVQCKHVAAAYLPGRRIRCITDETTTAIFSAIIEVTFTYAVIQSLDEFTFQIPKLAESPVTPSFGPLAGGTRVVISGSNIGIGSTRSVTLAGQPCQIENADRINASTVNFTCITEGSNSTTVRGQGAVVLRIDAYTETALGFDYDNNPSFASISPSFSLASGGTDLIVTGSDLDTVQQPRLLFYDLTAGNTQKRQVDDSSSVYGNPILSDPCIGILDSQMTCRAPALTNKNGSAVVAIGLLMDGVTSLLRLDANITVYLDPRFDTDHDFQIQPGQKRNLTLTGRGFFFLKDQIVIQVGDISCISSEVSKESVVCEIEVMDETAEGQYDVTVTIGNFRETVGSISVNQPFDPLIIYSSVLVALVVIVFVIFIVLFSVFYRKYKQKDKQNDLLLFELDRLESNMAQECKLGFAELQTDVDELTGDLSGSRLPYHDFHVYLLQSLFPGAKDHPVLHELQLPYQKKVSTESALRDFHQIVLNKAVLMTIIQALESQRAFTIRDKSNMGSLLMLALHDRLDYATEILKGLLSNLVRKTVAESYPKLLLRRTESVAEKMLSSWLAFTLHGYVIEHTGQPLYRLFKAVKAQLEKGPVDVVTGEARYSLSEQKLIRQQIDVKVINATVETEDGLQIPVKLLDCDSISQAKEKMLDAVHKNAPVSQRPALTAIDIEYRRVPKEEGDILRDEDGSNAIESGWRKINTLGHYWIPDKSVFRLVNRHEKPVPGRVFDYTGSLMVTHGYRNRSISDAEDGWRVWHLFKQHEEDPRSSPFISKKLVTEIYLPRMLSTKTILQSFVDNLFNSIFTLSQPPISPSQLYTPINTTFSPISADQGYAPGTDSLPVPIKYLFDFLDEEAANSKISDTDVLHTWKNNSLALRFWVNLIKNPEFVFDINKSAIVDSCLSVIAQAFIDGCSSSDAKPTINSPTSKLLFNKEVQGYKTNVKKYYEQISELPRIPEDMMENYLKDLSTRQSQLLTSSGNFHTESALNEIMRYCIKYRGPILETMRSSGFDSEAQLLDSCINRTM